MNLDFTFLTLEQIFGNIFGNNKLNIFDYYETIAPITDFAILLGGYVNDNCHYNNSNSLENRTGCYWTSSDDKDNHAYCVRSSGLSIWHDVFRRDAGGRPALPYSSICNILSNVVRERNGILEVEYGQYPQKVASKRLQDELESAYNYNLSSIRKTGKTYTTGSRRYDEEFSVQIIEEYSFDDGKKYVRVRANPYFDGSEFILSNGKKYKDGDYVWVEVSPIKWLVDEENDIAVSERLLFAGVPFNSTGVYKGDFSNTTIKKFMDENFSKDIIVPLKKQKNLEKDNVEILDKLLECIRNGSNNIKNINTDSIEKSEDEEVLDVFEEALFKMNNILQGNTTASLVTEEASNEKVKCKLKK